MSLASVLDRNSYHEVILAALAAVATAVPQGYGAPTPPRYASSEDISILKDDRIMEDDGRYNFDVETANGITVSESGAPGVKGAINSAGYFSYTAPDGTPVYVKFVANENGFQPESDLLPVAPEFPHPIPQFVLDQIAFAAQEDARRPSATYGAPQDQHHCMTKNNIDERRCMCPTSASMKFIHLAALVVTSAFIPQGNGDSPPRYGSYEQVPILKDERVIEDDGRYNVDVETGNGILLSESGSPVSKGAIASAGLFSYTAPDGTPISLKFVADENGFQPQGDHLPVAPEFPHPIPDFVLRQIEFAAQEDARRPQEPSGRYGAP
ncbi:uncharacterized protein LOC125025491 [Penaeus chinensis]|uniref:uncharacterized protein LOC125025491 n=1 Tax=Penaeus chinensis TaxID=139456 RepID=UPI001FB83356|nr:uncharacterized protein LOC125025491 [Penaeus chinensis]